MMKKTKRTKNVPPLNVPEGLWSVTIECCMDRSWASSRLVPTRLEAPQERSLLHCCCTVVFVTALVVELRWGELCMYVIGECML